MIKEPKAAGGYWIILALLGLSTCMWWLFAFLPVQVHSSEWVTRAQSVCFGMSATGLPNEGGWILLTFAPISLLVSLWAIAGGELIAELTEFNKGKLRSRVLLVVLSLLVVEGVWAGTRIVGATRTVAVVENNEAFPDNYPRVNLPVPNFKLVDQHGKKMTQDDFKGKVSLVVFVFAHCPSVCPTLVRDAGIVQKSVFDPRFQVVYLTLDPERDTPSSLPSLAKRWNLAGRSVLLSGDPEVVNQTLDGFKIPHTRDEKTGEIIHPAFVSLVDIHGMIAYQFNNPPQKWLSHAINILVAE